MRIKPHSKKFKVQYREEGRPRTLLFDTFQQAEAFVTAHEARKVERRPPRVPEQDLDKLISTFVSFTLGNRRPLTAKTVTSTLRQALPNVNWRQPEKSDLFSYCMARKYKSSTCKLHMKWVKSFCIFNKVDISTVDWRRLNLALSKEDKKDKNYLTSADFAVIIASVPPKYSIIYRYMAACGIRVRELTRLDVADFNPVTWLVTLPASKAKAKKLRTFVVPEELRSDFLEHMNHSKENPKAPLFHHDGVRISPNGLANIFKAQCEKAGIGDRNIHLLRALAIPIILRNSGNNFELVRNICGWDSQEMQKYTGMMEGEKAEFASNFTFTEHSTDTSREIEVLVRQVETISDGLALKSLASKCGVNYQWLFNFMENKRSVEVENLLKVVKHLEHRVEIYAKTK